MAERRDFYRLKSFYWLFCFCLAYNISISQEINAGAAQSSKSFFPAMSLENPLSPGKLGLVILGGAFQNKTRIANKPDANAAVYIGLGEPEKLIGAGATINIYGLTKKFGEVNNVGEGSFSFHLNKSLVESKLLIETGVDNLFSWGGEKANREYITYQRSFYFSANYLFFFKSENPEKTFSYLSVTGGLGNGYFRRDKNYSKNRSGSFDPFLSIATPVVKGTNIIAEWNGYDFGTGLSSIPYQKIPLMFTFEVTDLAFGSPRLIATISLPFNFLRANRAKAQNPIRPVGIKAVRAEKTI